MAYEALNGANNTTEYDQLDVADMTGQSLAMDSDEHVRLVTEIPAIQRLPIGERLLLARRRRLYQISRYERWLRRDLSAAAASERRSAAAAAGRRSRRSVRFTGAVALLEAVHRNDMNEVRSVLQYSPRGSVNSSVCDGLTALHQACIDGSVDMVNVLLMEFSADVNCHDDDHWTALHTVALCGHSNIARLLIDCGADVLALNSDGNMPYDLCEDEITLEVIETAMAKQGVTQEMINKVRAADEQKMLRELQRLSRQGHNLEFRGQRGETPLHVAACNGYVSVGEFLLSQSVDVGAVDNDSWTPLHHAAFWKQIAMLELLVYYGADVMAAALDGRTPCDNCGDAAVREWLLQLKATQSVTSPLPREHPQPPIAHTAAIVDLKTGVEGSYSSLYNSNLSLADKSTLTSSSRRLESLADKSNSRSSRKDARDEAQLWTSIQSLVDDEDMSDLLTTQTTNDATVTPSTRLVPPAQFRRPTPPSIDDQLELIADDLRNGAKLSSTSGQQVPPSNTSTTSASVTSRRSDNGDDRRRTDNGGKSKSAKNGRPSQTTSVRDGSNWQLKSAAETNNSGSKENVATNSVKPAELTNGQTVLHTAARGQTSAELKKTSLNPTPSPQRTNCEPRSRRLAESSITRCSQDAARTSRRSQQLQDKVPK